jgi:hypothetical protein
MVRLRSSLLWEADSLGVCSPLRLDKSTEVPCTSRSAEGRVSNGASRVGCVAGGAANGAKLLGGVNRGCGAAWSAVTSGGSGGGISVTSGAADGRRGASAGTGGGAGAVTGIDPGTISADKTAGVAGGLRAGIPVAAVVTGTGPIRDTGGGTVGVSRAIGV